MLPIHLLSTGKALPEQRVTSAELDTRLGHSAGYVRKKSGIDVRHHATLAEHQSELAGAAVRDALRRANVPAASIDLLISASGVQEQALPNTATAQELFNTCVANGGAKWDHSGMVKALERMANHDVAK